MEPTITQEELDLNEEIENERPAWIVEEMDIDSVKSIIHGGCHSGAYMPAVTYYKAVETMSDYGDDVMQYIENQLGELPQPNKGESWSGLACFYLSYAVELWCGQWADKIEECDRSGGE